MAQEQKKVNSQEVSSKSFDDILERMRSRVSEISDQGRVKKILDEDQSNLENKGFDEVMVNEGEQDRAFTEMSKQILANPEHSDAAEEEQSSLERHDDDFLSVETPEYSDEDKEEAETYSDILEALQMKDLSSLRSDVPNELEKIVSPYSKQKKRAASKKSEQEVIIAGPPNKEADVAMSAQENISVEASDVTEGHESEGDVSSDDKKKDYALAFDRLTKIASTMGKSLEEKSDVASETEEETVVKAVAEPVSEQVSDQVSEEVLEETTEVLQAKLPEETKGTLEVQETVSEQQPVSKQKNGSDELNPMFAIFEERNIEHNTRLNKIEEVLQSLTLSHEEMEKRSVDLIQQQEDSLRMVMRESQNVAEATATKLSENMSAQAEGKAVEAHSILRTDMETVQTGLLELVTQFEGSAQNQNNAYEMMQSSLVALHDKMNDLSAEQENMRAENAENLAATQLVATQAGTQAATQRVPEATVTQHIQEAFAANTPQKVSKEADGENLSLSSQVLKNFVNAPLVKSSGKSDVEPQSLFGNKEEPMGSVAQPAVHRSFSTEEEQGETVLDNKTKKSSKAPVLLAISSMFMFSVSGFLFYDHYQKQGFESKMASRSVPTEKTIASNIATPDQTGLIGEKKIVEWTYSGDKKKNVAQLSQADKSLGGNGAANYADIMSNTEIIEVASYNSNAPLTTASIGGGSALNLGSPKKSNKAGSFKRPSVLIGSTSLRQSAGKGVASAMFEVARRYQNGKGVKKNYKQAVKWYRRAAEKEYAPAQYRLGTLYERGRGVTQNIESARDWYRRSAKLGNVKAMHNLGVIFSGQKQIRPDYALAIRWFTKAAQYGLADSQFNLAIINYNGLGKSKDIVEAYKWFALASQNGDKAAKEQKENIAQKMKIKQIMDGRKKANSWTNLAIPTKTNIDLTKKYAWQDFAEL